MPKFEQLKALFISTAKRRRSVLVFPLIGLLILLLMVASKAGPQRRVDTEPAHVVQALVVTEIPTSARAISYGSVEADVDWRAMAEVSGTVVFTHSGLKAGATLAKDTVVLRIDPLDYELALIKAQADVATAQAKLASFEAEQKNSITALAVAQKSLDVAQQELKRKQKLLQRKLTSKTDVDAQQQMFLSQQQQYLNRQSVVDTLPSRRNELSANLRLQQARVKEQQRNLNRTEIRLPFTARIGLVSVENNEFLNRGQHLFSANAMEKVEVSAQFPMESIAALLRGSDLNIATDSLLDQRFLSQLALTAQVQTTFNSANSSWPAKVERIGGQVDIATRTLPIVVSVQRPYDQAIAGETPPLLPGMYVQVQIQGPSRARLSIPRSALHPGGYVYVIDQAQQLEKRLVEIDFNAGDIAAVAKGLSAGEKIVLTDLVPAVPGMKLAPVFSQVSVQQMADLAQGDLEVAGVEP